MSHEITEYDLPSGMKMVLEITDKDGKAVDPMELFKQVLDVAVAHVSAGEKTQFPKEVILSYLLARFLNLDSVGHRLTFSMIPSKK